MDPADQKVSIGNMVILQCLTDTSKESDAVVSDWLFGENSVSVILDLSERYELNENGSLTISNFDPSFAGLYRCVVINSTGRCVSKATKLLYFNSELNDYNHIVWGSVHAPTIL